MSIPQNSLYDYSPIWRRLPRDPHLSATNQPLVRKYITALEAEHARISELKLMIERQHERISEALYSLESLRAPVRRIPSEILCEIFAFCCLDGVVLSKKDWDVVPIAVGLSCVCFRWRQEAIGLSVLWSRLSYELKNVEGWERDENKSWKRLHRITQLYLGRARNHSLSLKFDIFDTGEGSHIQAFNPSLDLLSQRAEQWDSLSFRFFPAFLRLPAVRRLEGKLCNLRHLQIEDSYLSSIGEPIDFTSLGPFPALRVVDLILTGSGSKPLGLPYNQLRHLDFLATVDRRSVLSVIDECTSLTHLHLSGLSDSKDVPRQCILSNLRSIRFGIYHPAFFKEVLPNVVAPQLQSLEVYMEWQAHRLSGDQATNLFRFVKQSEGCITSFILRDLHLNEQDMVHLLHLLPRLRVLRILDTPAFPVVRSLALLRHLSFRVPRLENIALRARICPEDAVVFADTIRARFGRGSGENGYQDESLRMVELVLIDEKMIPSCLSELMRGGINVIVRVSVHRGC